MCNYLCRELRKELYDDPDSHATGATVMLPLVFRILWLSVLLSSSTSRWLMSLLLGCCRLMLRPLPFPPPPNKGCSRPNGVRRFIPKSDPEVAEGEKEVHERCLPPEPSPGCPGQWFGGDSCRRRVLAFPQVAEHITHPPALFCSREVLGQQECRPEVETRNHQCDCKHSNPHEEVGIVVAEVVLPIGVVEPRRQTNRPEPNNRVNERERDEPQPERSPREIHDPRENRNDDSD